MSDTILTEISKLNDFTRDMCFENGHEPTIFEHVSGETLYDAVVNILTSTGEKIATGVSLREVIVIYLQTHLIILTDHNMTEEWANKIYAMMSRHFYAMGIEGFYAPLALRKYNPKSEFIQYTIVVVPESVRGNSIASKMAELVKTNKFESVAPTGENVFSDDAAKVYGNYVNLIAYCLMQKSVQKTNAIKTSD